MSDPYSPSQTTAREYLAVIPQLPWHAKLIIAILLIGAIESGTLPTFYTVKMIWTGVSIPNIFAVLYLRFLYTAFLLGAAYLLYKRSKHVMLPLLFALPLLAWSVYRFFSYTVFPPTYNLYGSYAEQFLQYLSMLPQQVFETIANIAIPFIALVYCWRHRGTRKST